MQFETIRYEIEDRIATITLNRPDKLNAVSPRMVRELRAAYDAAESDDSVWTIVVTGNGRAFCAGADVVEIPEDGKVIYEEAYLSTLDAAFVKQRFAEAAAAMGVSEQCP